MWVQRFELKLGRQAPVLVRAILLTLQILGLLGISSPYRSSCVRCQIYLAVPSSEVFFFFIALEEPPGW